MKTKQWKHMTDQSTKEDKLLTLKETADTLRKGEQTLGLWRKEQTVIPKNNY